MFAVEGIALGVVAVAGRLLVALQNHLRARVVIGRLREKDVAIGPVSCGLTLVGSQRAVPVRLRVCPPRCRLRARRHGKGGCRNERHQERESHALQ
jgi:hypothetical protein